MDDTVLTIGAFASKAEVSVETIRFYQRRGLLREPARAFGKIRRYGQEDVGRVRFIKAAQGLGFSLDEIAGLLRLEDGANCERARGTAEVSLRRVRLKLEDLQRIETALAALVRACRDRSTYVNCPLIDALQRDSEGEIGLTGTIAQ